MDVNKILQELRQERDLMEEAILNLERLGAGRPKRRGRPPKWLQAARERQAASKDAPAAPNLQKKRSKRKKKLD